MLKHFYEHFDEDLSEIPVQSTELSTLFENDSHHFPRRYLKSKALPKMNMTNTSSEWLSARSCNEMNETKNPFDSMIPHTSKRVNRGHFMLSAARLSQSYIEDS